MLQLLRFKVIMLILFHLSRALHGRLLHDSTLKRDQEVSEAGRQWAGTILLSCSNWNRQEQY